MTAKQLFIPMIPAGGWKAAYVFLLQLLLLYHGCENTPGLACQRPRHMEQRPSCPLIQPVHQALKGCPRCVGKSAEISRASWSAHSQSQLCEWGQAGPATASQHQLKCKTELNICLLFCTTEASWSLCSTVVEIDNGRIKCGDFWNDRGINNTKSANFSYSCWIQQVWEWSQGL